MFLLNTDLTADDGAFESLGETLGVPLFDGEIEGGVERDGLLEAEGCEENCIDQYSSSSSMAYIAVCADLIGSPLQMDLYSTRVELKDSWMSMGHWTQKAIMVIAMLNNNYAPLTTHC